MITEERLQELLLSPREAYIMKAEMLELVSAYRAQKGGLSATTDAESVWLQIKSPSGKVAAIDMGVLADQHKGLIGEAIREWVSAAKEQP